jgi:hypothetical protein
MQNFKVMDAMVIKFAIVDTTYGTFRVATNGNLTLWNEDAEDFAWFDADKFEAWELAAVEEAGRDAMLRDGFKLI